MNKKNRRSKKNFKTEKGQRQNCTYKDKTVINENDVSWYTRYPSLIGPNSSINFNLRYGSSLKSVNDANQVYGDETNCTTVPGIIIRDFMPMYADSGVTASAVNVASKNLFTYVRHANSGSVNYEASDLMQYLITVMNLYTQIEQLKRDLRIIHTYNPQNMYVGQNTLTAIHNQAYASDLLMNSAIYTGQLNEIIAKMNSFKIPKDMAILDRHLWLVSNIFKDDDLTKATQYINYCPTFAHYDWANHTVELRNIDRGNVNAFSSYVLMLDTEINSLLQYEDIGIMLGDILKAYKQENCRVFTPLSTGEILDPVISHEILDQFRNYIIPYSQSNVTNLDYNIKQLAANTQIIYAEQLGHTSTSGEFTYTIGTIGDPSEYNNDCEFNPILIVDKDIPTNEDIILNTRMSLSFKFDVDTVSTATVSDYATELPIACTVYSYSSNNTSLLDPETILSGTRFSTLNVIGTFNNVDAASNDLMDYFYVLNQIHKASGTAQYVTYFNWFNQSDSQTVGGLSNYYNGKNVILLDANWLKRLHDACKLSEWTMPMFKLLQE